MPDPLGKAPRDYETDHKLINDFASDMFEKMRKNYRKAHWSTVTQQWLIRRLREEVLELEESLVTGENVISECADVANFAAMIADNERNK